MINFKYSRMIFLPEFIDFIEYAKNADAKIKLFTIWSIWENYGNQTEPRETKDICLYIAGISPKRYNEYVYNDDWPFSKIHDLTDEEIPLAMLIRGEYDYAFNRSLKPKYPDVPMTADESRAYCEYMATNLWFSCRYAKELGDDHTLKNYIRVSRIYW